MNFNLSIGELLIISLFFITSISCIITYSCCSKCLKVLEEDKSISKAINKLRIFDQYILSKINLLIALFYFGMSYMFIHSFLDSSGYIFFLASLLSFVLTLFTTFISRLCYCYTCNVLLETKLNEWECLMVNFKRLITVYVPFVIASLIIPTIYLLEIPIIYKNIICIVSLALMVIEWVILTPRIMILMHNAKKISKYSVLNYRLEQLMELHNIKKYKLYLWDTSKSRESNAMVSGLRTCYLFVSSSLIEDVTLPELETVVTHEIGHVKNNHLVKKMIGKLFVVIPLILMIALPYIFDFKLVSKGLVYLLIIFITCLSILLSIGVERKYEMQADLYVAAYNDPDLFASALKKITKYEEEEDNTKLDELFQSHPSIKSRIQKVEKKNKS